MYIRYAISAVIVLITKVLASLLAPFIGLFGRDDGSLPWILRWATTHDAPLTAWWYDNYSPDSWIKKRFTQKDYDTQWWIRRYCDMMWIIRNPAYNVAKFLGYNQKDMIMTNHQDEGKLWDSGYPNQSFYTAVNANGQKAFMYQKQWYYYKDRCVEIYLGWKLFWNESDETCMVVVRVSPFRRYSKKPIQ